MSDDLLQPMMMTTTSSIGCLPFACRRWLAAVVAAAAGGRRGAARRRGGAPLVVVEVDPARGRSCFGFSGVLSGQKRVPEPPASTTAHLIEAGQRGSGAGGQL